MWTDSLSFGLTVQRHSSLHPGHGVSLFRVTELASFAVLPLILGWSILVIISVRSRNALAESLPEGLSRLGWPCGRGYGELS